MPLPHFLLTLAAVIVAALITLVVALAAGIPVQLLALIALIGAAIVHFARPGDDPRQNPGA